MITSINGLIEINSSAGRLVDSLQKKIADPTFELCPETLLAESQNIVLITSGLLERREMKESQSIGDLLATIQFEPQTCEIE